MTLFIIKRLLFIIPTVFLVLIFVFFLNQYAPGDPVEAELRLEGFERGLDAEIYKQSYSNAADRLKLNRAVFYFSITPNYIVEEINEILPLSERKTIRRLLKIVKDPSPVLAYHHALESISQEYSRQKPAGPITIINKMKLEEQPKEISIRFLELKSSYSDELSSFQDLEEAITKLNSSHPGIVYPVFRWYGFNNQFHYWIQGLFKPTQIKSIKDGDPVLAKISKALKWTLSMSFIALILCVFISIALSMVQVYYLNTYFDRACDLFFYGLYSIPLFWFASLMVVFFTTPEYGAWTDIFPSIGIKYWLISESFWVQFTESFKQLILPILCLTITSLPYLIRQLKSDLLKELDMPYILAARAKGLKSSFVLTRHALPNSLIPFISIISGALPSLFTGSLIIEVIFNIPGVGRLMYDAIVLIDWPVSFTILIIIALVTIVSYLLGDIANALINPRIHKSLGIK